MILVFSDYETIKCVLWLDGKSRETSDETVDIISEVWFFR